ncbi:unnamed protein product [Notodromas monacha]|uniref:NACHT domain-containing protein n=1 Tax=Notodromas monacha TaxID=399045 RepID=A0A7R9BLE3_9CRUS|nr:unnamed protein product [Notodromas monacha]CAG0916160.1 unnamed protein product [Notodromas monacha]
MRRPSALPPRPAALCPGKAGVLAELDAAYVSTGPPAELCIENHQSSCLKYRSKIPREVVRELHYSLSEFLLPLWPLKDGVRQRILIEGGSGTGKTTLGVKLAYDWGKGDVGAVQGYHLCFVVPLRYYDGSLLNLIQKELLPKQFSGKATLLDMYEYMRNNDDKLLLILDGWDELATARNNPQSHSELVDIIKGRVFPRSCVVVMTNPGVGGCELRKLVQRVYYMRNFDAPQIRQFVHGYFKSIDKPDEAEKVLCSNVMQSADLRCTLLGTPVMCLMTCLLFEESNGSYVMESASRIYEDLTQMLLRRASEKRSGISKHIVTRDVSDFLLRVLGKLSLKFFGTERALFYEQELKDSDAYQALELGLLSKGWCMSRREKHVLVHPLHKSFLHFWVAKYLASISPSRTIEMLDSVRWIEPDLWLRFLVGCMKPNAHLIFERFKFEAIPTKQLFALLKENGHHSRSVHAVCELLNTKARAQIQMDSVNLEGWAMVLSDPSCSTDTVEIILKQRAVLSDQWMDRLFAALRLNESVKTVKLGTSLGQDLSATDIKVISQYIRMVIQKPKLQSLELVFRTVDEDKTQHNAFAPLIQCLCCELRRGAASPTLNKLIIDMDMTPEQVVALCRALECCPSVQVVHLLHLVCTQRAFLGVAELVAARPLLALNLTGAWYPSDNEEPDSFQTGSLFDVKSTRSSSSGATSPAWASYGIEVGSLRRFNTLRRNPHPPPICDCCEHSRISDSERYALFVLTRIRSLKSLNISGWTVKLEEARSLHCLGSFLKTCTIRDLNLAGCKIFVSVEDPEKGKYDSLLETLSKGLQPYPECEVAFLNLSGCQVMMMTSRGQVTLQASDLIPFLSPLAKLTSLNASLKRGNDPVCKIGEKTIINFFQSLGSKLSNLRRLTISNWSAQIENSEKASKVIAKSLKQLDLKALTVNRLQVVDGLGQKSLSHIFLSTLLLGLPQLTYFSIKGTVMSVEEAAVVARCIAERHKGPFLDLSVRHFPPEVLKEFRAVLIASGKFFPSVIRCAACHNEELRIELRPAQNTGVWDAFACSLK